MNTGDLCEDGWTFNDASFKCYKYVKKTTSWSEANRECQSMIPVTQPPALPITRGHLASIRDEAENTFVAGLIEANSDAWLGGTKLRDGTWTWTDGAKWTFSNWRWDVCHQNGKEDSLSIKANGDWNDAGFSWLLSGYVCQYLNLNQFT